MQRQIKFRAWNKKLSRFILEPQHFALTLDGKIVNFDCSGYDYIDDFALMQYTGLKDKNGVEIYEGDIIDITRAGGDRGYVPVVFKDGNFCLYVKYWVDEYYPLNTYDSEHYEVIGNIHEKPELLESKNA